MTSSATIELNIGNAIPPGNATETGNVIALWQQISSFFSQRHFCGPESADGESVSYLVDLNADALLDLMENARQEAGSFNDWQKRHIENPQTRIDASVVIRLTPESGQCKQAECYRVATVFLQQLVLAANIAVPGSVQLLNTRFVGPGAHCYEAQEFDARILYGAFKSASYNEWPPLKLLVFDAAWQWLELCQTSRVVTAISRINKTLFTMLKVAEQRHETSARTVLLVIYQLEQLLDCRQANSLELIHNRTRMILGNIPEAANCLNELAEIRSSLFLANQPVHRPPLIAHNASESLRDQMGQHNSAVEAGTAIVLALIHNLISRDATCYEFTESVTCK